MITTRTQFNGASLMEDSTVITIDLEETNEKAVPLPDQKGQFAFVQAMLPSVLVFAAILGSTYGYVWLARWLGYQPSPISANYATTVLIVAGLLLSSLISASNSRFTEDQEAVGAINVAFRQIVAGLGDNEDMRRIVRHLAWSMFFLFRGEPIMVTLKGKQLHGAQPILAVLMKQIDSEQKFSPEMKYCLLSRVGLIQSALGGIARRRAYPLLRSRYVVNTMFLVIGVALMSISTATAEQNSWVGQAVAGIFAYGLITILYYVRHMASGIGYDPGDIQPNKCLKGWLEEF